MRNERGGQTKIIEFEQFSPGLVQTLGAAGIASIGVMPLFYDQDGKILTVEQKKTKKVPEGGLSLSAETSKYRHSGAIEPTEQTLARLVHEELGVLQPEQLAIYAVVNHQPIPPFIFQGNRPVYAYMPIVGLEAPTATQIVHDFQENDEIAGVRFASLGELRMSHLRRGMSAVVTMIASHQPLLHDNQRERAPFRLPVIETAGNYAGDVRLDRQGLIRK